MKLRIPNPKTLSGLFFIACACLFSQLANAGEVTLTWTAPTQYTDGTPIPATGTGALSSYRVEYGTCNTGGTFGVKQGEQTVAAPATTMKILNLAPGTYCFQIFAKIGTGQESGPSDPCTKVVTQPIPKSPIFTTTTAAYGVVVERNLISLVRVGTIPVRTECNTAIQVNGHYLVSRSRVAWIGTLRPDAVVAKCAPLV